MTGSMDYLLGQVLSLIFYIMTLVIYYRARKEYVGGKIAAAMKLIIIFLAILFLADFVDYFFIMLLPMDRDTVLIIKILLKLAAICVLFFGGLRFFVSRRETQAPSRETSTTLPAVKELKPQRGSERKGPAEKAAPFDASDDRKPTLGRYEILEQIGRGAMGIVYKGRDPKLNRLTAIKTIRFIDEFDDDQAEIIKEHFYHEAEVVAKLSHPNIVTVFDVGEDLDLSYLAMEYLEGQSLEKFTKSGRLLALGECLDIVIQVCDALAYAHEHDIIHRDIKPENIMLLKDGTVKVTDFGIARVATSTRTRTGVIKGTPYYMSPEQTKGIKLTGPSDIFSLGVVFYQLLTGHLPFTGENMAAIMYQTTAADPPPPTTYNPEIDPAIVAILDQALTKQLEARYQSAQEMGDQLRQFRRKLPGAMPSEPDWAASPSGIAVASQNDIEDLSVAQSHKLQVVPETASGIATEKGIELDGVRLEMDATATPETPAPEIGTDLTTESDAQTLDHAFGAAPDRQDESPAITFPDTKQTYPPTFDWDYEAKGDAGETVETDPAFSESVIERVGTRFKITDNLFARITSLVIIGSFAAIALSVVYYLFWHPSASVDPVAIERDQVPSASQLTTDQELQAKLEEQKRQIQAIQAQREREKQAEQERLAQEAEAQQAEQERLAGIEQENQAERERLTQIEQAKREEQRRLEQIEQAKQAEQERQARAQREQLSQQQQTELETIAQFVTNGRNAWQRQDYREARQHYEAALQKVTASRFKAERRFLDYKNEIKTALKNDDIIYGAKGYIKYHNKWMSPQEYETTLFQEGYVKYQGRLIHHTGLRKTIERVTEPDVSAYLTLRYQGQRVHTKNINFRSAVLNRSDNQSSDYTVYYDWEVWTFKDLGKGRCALSITYYADKDNWRIVKGCE